MKTRIRRDIFLLVCAALMLTMTGAGAEAPAFTAAVSLSEGAPETAFAVYSSEEPFPDGDGAFIYRIEYTVAGETEKRELTFPCYGETDLVPLLRFVDLNFDGHLDLEALYVSGATNTTCTYFLNDGDDAGFTLAPILDNLSSYNLYAKQRIIVNYEHNSAASGVYTIFRYEEGVSLPYVYRIASFLDEYVESTQTFVYKDFVAEYDAAGNETILLDQTRGADFDEASWKTWYDARMALLWDGLDMNEQPVQR